MFACASVLLGHQRVAGAVPTYLSHDIVNIVMSAKHHAPPEAGGVHEAWVVPPRNGF
jgi:hypothetical protein